jgi:molybdenum cofactor cytidylyltransferase
MGGPKALMQVGARPWWKSQFERLRAVGVLQTWVISQEVEQAMLESGPIPFVSVRGQSSETMFDSVMRGIDSLIRRPPSGLFILPVDVPAAGKAVWDALCESDHVSRPQYHRLHGHPVYLPWPWIEDVLRPGSTEAEDRPDLRLDTLITPVVRNVPVKDPAVVFNLNTPEDVRRWVAENGAGPT